MAWRSSSAFVRASRSTGRKGPGKDAPCALGTSAQAHRGRAAGEEKGFAGHRDVSEAFRKSDHSDPGEHFPWGWYLTRVRRYRWRYFVFRITANGRLIVKSEAAREDKAAGANGALKPCVAGSFGAR